MNFVQISVWFSGNILCCWLENQRSNIGKVNKMKKVYKNYRRNTHTQYRFLKRNFIQKSFIQKILK